MARTKTDCPQHVAIIMDGNGRWASQHLRPRAFGHKAGMDNVKKIAVAASQRGVKILTLYAFSTENWQRPTDEVSYLMKLPITFFDKFMPELMAENIQVRVIGFIEQLPEATRHVVEQAINQTQDNTGMILNFAFNYGSRSELTTAIQAMAQDAVSGKLNPQTISETTVSSYLMTAQFGDLADPDLLIRTSGELRLSNFLLWQLAYTEFYFSNVHWPDFDEEELDRAFLSYSNRQRRYGKL